MQSGAHDTAQLLMLLLVGGIVLSNVLLLRWGLRLRRRIVLARPTPSPGQRTGDASERAAAFGAHGPALAGQREPAR